MKKVALIMAIIVFVILTSCTFKTVSKFNNFMVISSTNTIYHPKMKPNNVIRDGISVRVKILNRDNEEYTILDYYRTKYFFRVINSFGQDGVDLSSTYSIWAMGNERQQVYGQPLLEIGKEYILFNFNTNIEPEQTMAASYWFDISEHDGVEYLYPYYLDISEYHSSKRIFDDEENAIYKEGKHNDIIKYLRKNNIPNPTFDYKISIDCFFKEK